MRIEDILIAYGITSLTEMFSSVLANLVTCHNKLLYISDGNVVSYSIASKKSSIVYDGSYVTKLLKCDDQIFVLDCDHNIFLIRKSRKNLTPPVKIAENVNNVFIGPYDQTLYLIRENGENTSIYINDWNPHYKEKQIEPQETLLKEETIEGLHVVGVNEDNYSSNNIIHVSCTGEGVLTLFCGRQSHEITGVLMYYDNDDAVNDEGYQRELTILTDAGEVYYSGCMVRDNNVRYYIEDTDGSPFKKDPDLSNIVEMYPIDRDNTFFLDDERRVYYNDTRTEIILEATTIAKSARSTAS